VERYAIIEKRRKTGGERALAKYQLTAIGTLFKGKFSHLSPFYEFSVSHRSQRV
jgi:hypothetical protein